MNFPDLVIRYRRRYLIGHFIARAIRWIPAGAALAVLGFLFSRRMDIAMAYVLPAFILPSLAAGLSAVFRSRNIAHALSWLDRRIGGRQELQAAWEFRCSDGVLAGAVSRRGEEILHKLEPRPPVPAASPVSSLFALVSFAILALVLVLGGRLAAADDEDLRRRGEELEAWAEAWAEESAGDAESGELADRMKNLGRRMADGEMDSGMAENALRDLEEDIGQRRNDLARDRIAESLADDFDLDRDSAEAFRTGKKRLPADTLSELMSSLAGTTVLGNEDRDLIEKLLSDPDLRDRSGNGRPELTEDLLDALEKGLGSDDPRLSRLDRASEESRRAMEAGPEQKESPGNDPPRPADTPALARSTDSGDEGDSRGSGSGEGDGRTPPRGKMSTGGSGRGDIPVADEDTGDLPPMSADVGDNPMRLPSTGPGGGSWKTAIRAYGEAGDPGGTADSGGLPAWSAEVESVIGSEDIPKGVRDYVKEYFLALEAGEE